MATGHCRFSHGLNFPFLANSVPGCFFSQTSLRGALHQEHLYHMKCEHSDLYCIDSGRFDDGISIVALLKGFRNLSSQQRGTQRCGLFCPLLQEIRHRWRRLSEDSYGASARVSGGGGGKSSLERPHASYGAKRKWYTRRSAAEAQSRKQLGEATRGLDQGSCINARSPLPPNPHSPLQSRNVSVVCSPERLLTCSALKWG